MATTTTAIKPNSAAENQPAKRDDTSCSSPPPAPGTQLDTRDAVTDDMSRKREQLIAKHRAKAEQRHQQRLAAFEAKTSAINQNSLHMDNSKQLDRMVAFESTFFPRLDAIEAQLDKPGECETELAALRGILAQNVIVLPAYVTMKAQTRMKAVESKLMGRSGKISNGLVDSTTSNNGNNSQNPSDASTAKPAFSFKRSKLPSETPQQYKIQAQKGVIDVPIATMSDSDAAENISDSSSVVISGKSNEIIRIGNESNGLDIALIGLEDCKAFIRCSPGTLRLRNLVRCNVLCWPVSRSIMVENCDSCVFVIACQQLRTHSTHDCQLYLHAQARPIIEDCRNLRFAPYNLKDPNLLNGWESSGLSQTTKNLWESIDDFNWLDVKQPSPNWSILPVSDRIENEMCLE